MTTAADILAQMAASGIRIRAKGERILASPRDQLTDEIRALIREHKTEILAALVRETAGSGGEQPLESPSNMPPRAPDKGADCMSCTNLVMRLEKYQGTRRLWWWGCDKGYALMEGRNFGERVLLASPECHAAAAFEPWKEGQR